MSREDLTGRVNGYTCDRCGRATYVVHAHDGVTPMFLACRAEGVEPSAAECKGRGVSMMYPSSPLPEHIIEAVAWEWYRPDAVEMKRLRKRARQRGEVETLHHVEQGGALLRPLTDAGRAALAAVPA